MLRELVWTGLPKQHDGVVEALRNLWIARRRAVSQRADCVRRINTLIITARWADGTRR